MYIYVLLLLFSHKPCLTLCDCMDCSTPDFPSPSRWWRLDLLPSPGVSSNSCPLSQKHLILSSPSPLVLSLSQHQGLFQKVSSLQQLAKVLELQLQLSFSFSPSSEYSVLISFRIDWFDLLAVQSTLKSLLQHYNSKASILWLSLLYGPTLTSTHAYWKNHSFD